MSDEATKKELQSVDTNTIPQSLVERVEIVTGGASAVYGSDAVTGVINFIINKKFNGNMLAEAMCKIEGFRYQPSDTIYWQHGHSTERDFVYVTTQTLGREQLQKLSDDVGDDRSLLICCGAYRVKSNPFANLTLKKIPKAVMSKCEWGKDDYSLQIAELPPPEPQEAEPVAPPKPGVARARRKAMVAEESLFGGGNGDGGKK